jgi:hypothetical protein
VSIPRHGVSGVMGILSHATSIWEDTRTVDWQGVLRRIGLDKIVGLGARGVWYKGHERYIGNGPDTR